MLNVNEMLHIELSDNNAIACLLNCYIREYALPRQEVFFSHDSSVSPLLFRHRLSEGNELVKIDFPSLTASCFILADQVSCFGRCRFVSKPYLKSLGKSCRPLGGEELCRLLLTYLSMELSEPFNHEFLNQLKNSMAVTKAFLSNKPKYKKEYDSFIQSEQSLLWGHALHPTPKSRQGIDLPTILQCSPEVASSFSLFWFSIDSKLLRVLGDNPTMPATIFKQLNNDQGNNKHHHNQSLYPCHPWEVNTIMQQPLIIEAIKQGLIKPVGFLGLEMFPTSSVRTLYRKGLHSQLKFSIHVRLTNCIRKNAWYELESAVFLSKLIKPLVEEGGCNSFKVMAEPAATTIDLSHLARELSIEGDREVTESFGILYRQSISDLDQQCYQPLMAGSLFAWDKHGDSIIVNILQQRAIMLYCRYDELALDWAIAYFDAIVPGVLKLFFLHGVVLEPHQQNTVIGFTNELPSCVWIRDLEGTKLISEYWPKTDLSELSEQAKISLYYSRKQGWQRIAYCLLVNNLSEAIFHLSDGNSQLESKLWQLLFQRINDWQHHHGLQPELQELLQGSAIPSKNNLMTRLLKKADRLASYTLLKNPYKVVAA